MGNLKLALFLALKSIIKGNRWALLMIIMVMSLSFANLLLTPSILAGVTETIDRQQVDTLFANIIIDPPPGSYYLDDAGRVEKKIARIPGVSGVAAHLDNRAFIEYKWLEKDSPSDKGDGGTWSVTGIDPGRETAITTIHKYMIQGSYLEADDRDSIILGVEIAGGTQAESSELLTLDGVQVGEKVRLTYPNGIQREYTVKGIFKAQEITRADRTAFITRQEMASVLGRTVFTDRASQLLVKTDPSFTESRVFDEVAALNIDGTVRNWREYGGALGGIAASFNIIASLINAIGLVVAGIVMFIVIYINVLNRKRQIGILRAIGIKRNVIVGSYLAQALFYAALGIILGGLIFGYGIQPYFDFHPLDLALGQVTLAVEPLTVQYAVIGLIMAAILAGLIPALTITRQAIIRAIWGN